MTRPGLTAIPSPILPSQEPLIQFAPDEAEAIIQRGQRARDLLANPSFEWVVNDLTNYHLAALVASPPGPSGADAVIYHHSQQHALSELVATLTGYDHAGAEMQAVLGNESDDEDNL